MSATRHLRFWLIGGALFVAALWLLRDVLLPFVAGIAIAYFLDPIVERLEKPLRSRTAATLVTLALVSLLGIGMVLAVAPMIADQAQSLAAKVPQYIARLYQRFQPLLDPLRERLGMVPGTGPNAEGAAGIAGDALKFVGTFLAGILSQGFAVLNVLALVFLTPVVAFYLMRDWPRLIAVADGLLPRNQAPAIRRIARDSNRAVGGYVRGQAIVCLSLAVFYSVTLMIVGLEFGLIIGLIIGVIAFIPFVGSWVGAILAIGMALAQFPPEWIKVAIVLAIFALGQFLEGNILTPKLVGDRVGVHAVWLMFALLAGGALFGFVGLLLSVPVAAVLGVIVRFFVARYRESPYYRGAEDTPPTA
ncbi:MAG: AI-2E family transporter [Alphaproteobacteria bacterium]|nr:AI-2E family transporter [Alphaproteobacteria bacterium]MCW5739145.1 AI-2E family transporter [Alphaproteobacteria bacterium]